MKPERKSMTIDPAVASILGDGTRRQEERKLSVQDRKRKQLDRARNKLRLDCPEWVEALIREAAAREKLSMSAMATFLLVEGLRAYRKGAEPDKEATRHPRFEYVLAEMTQESEGLE